jgi:hypothetical protein
MRLPNLFLIGSQKGGSTKLFRYLEQHPQIGIMGTKEVNLFSADSESEARQRLAKITSIDESATYLIDGSVDYSRYPRFGQTAANIHAICKEQNPKFVYIMRHPVDRLISNYFWNRDRYGEHRPILKAVEEENQYVNTSLYDLQIKAYAQHFDLANFCFLSFDDFVVDMQATAGKVFEWLGLEPCELKVVGRTGTETNKKMTRQARFPVINKIVWANPGLRKAINTCVPQHWIRAMANGLTEDVERQKVDTQTRRYLLERYFMDSIVQTQKLTGLSLEHWLDAYQPQAAENPAAISA